MKLKLFLSVIVGALVIVSLFIFSPFQSDEAGSIHIVVTDREDDVVIDEWVDFYEGDNLYLVLDRNFEIETSQRYSSSYGRLLLGIEDVQTDFESTFIHISKDNVSANLGIEYIALEDGSRYDFDIRVPN